MQATPKLYSLVLLLHLLPACSTSTPSQAPTAVETTPSEAAFGQEVLTLVNAERTAEGLTALSWNADVADVAWLHAKDMVSRGFFDHINPDGASAGDRLIKAQISFSAAGENIAQGHQTAQEAVQAWMNSPPHRENILHPDFTELGVGIVQTSNPNETSWVQVFRTP